MRKIEEEMLEAILEKRNWTFNNTKVDIIDDKIAVSLWDNVIAIKSDGQWMLCNNNCLAWNTVTTRSRLNALATIFNDSYLGVSCKKGVLYVHYDGEVKPMDSNKNYTYIGK